MDDILSNFKSATQSTVRSCNPPCGPDKALDGDRNTCMKTDFIGPSSPDKTVWWTVDLGENRSIHSINIYFKDYNAYGDYSLRQRGRFAGFSIYISNTPKKEDGILCYKNTLPLPPLDFNTTCTEYGRYVIYYNERLDGVIYPEGYMVSSLSEICEVEVQGCMKAGVYGYNCSIPCPLNCQEQRCNIFNGTCWACTAGYVGHMCSDECPWGWYGQTCKSQCSGHCGRNIHCNHVTGNCDGGCAPGWMGKLCNQRCYNGAYGPGCIHNCSSQCLNGTFCQKENGFCEKGCKPGYVGILCNTVCPSGLFGSNCSQSCSKYCNNGLCDHINGSCLKGCMNGYTGMRCFNHCQNGTFGYKCENTCSKNCIGICEHTDGRCDCLPGFTGSPNCKIECRKGFFGVNCQHRCSGHCLNGETCSRFDGTCPNGCKNQFYGLLCEYQDKTSSGKRTVEFYILVGLGIIFGLFIFVFVILIRQGILKFNLRKMTHPISKDNKGPNEGSASRNTTTKGTIYEELKEIENVNQYQELPATD